MTSSEIVQQVDEYIDANMDAALDVLARLVAQPSVAAQNLGIEECAQLVAELLEGSRHLCGDHGNRWQSGSLRRSRGCVRQDTALL